MLTDPLFLTILLESIALVILGERHPLFYLYWIAITTLTNIPANLFISHVFHGNTFELCIIVSVIELFVFLSEFLLCLAYTKNKKISAKYSAICNISSFSIGTLILMLF